MKIYAPVKDTNGVHASVLFVNGVGETNDPHLIKWFETHGYTVEKCENGIEMSQNSQKNCVEMSQNTLEICDEPEEVEMMGYAEKTPNFEEMTPNELRDWAKANGLGGAIKNTRNKEKLLELIRG